SLACNALLRLWLAHREAAAMRIRLIRVSAISARNFCCQDSKKLTIKPRHLLRDDSQESASCHTTLRKVYGLLAFPRNANGAARAPSSVECLPKRQGIAENQTVLVEIVGEIGANGGVTPF